LGPLNLSGQYEGNILETDMVTEPAVTAGGPMSPGSGRAWLGQEFFEAGWSY